MSKHYIITLLLIFAIHQAQIEPCFREKQLLCMRFIKVLLSGCRWCNRRQCQKRAASRNANRRACSQAKQIVVIGVVYVGGVRPLVSGFIEISTYFHASTNRYMCDGLLACFLECLGEVVCLLWKQSTWNKSSWKDGLRHVPCGCQGQYIKA